MNELKVKIKVPEGAQSIKRAQYKALKRYDEYDSPPLRVLGVPFGGPIKGRDSDGEAFHEGTDIAMNVGDSVPVTYYHGFGPDNPNDWQEQPVWLGVAKYAGKDDRGHWFEAQIDTEEQLALRVLEDTAKARASSGAVSHLVRMGKAGLIDVWPVGELALFETSDWKQPANDYAVIELLNVEVPTEASAKAEQVSAAVEVSTTIEETIEIENKGTKTMDENKELEQAEQAPAVDMEAMFAKFAEQMNGRLDEIITAKSAPMVKRIPKFDKDDETDAFLYWVKTGNKHAAAKAALQEGEPTEGGYLVPEDFLGRIIAKRDEISIMRSMGAQVIGTSRDKLNVPIENAAVAPARTAEEGAYNQSEPTFAQVQIEIHKVTNLVKVSEELLEDEAAGLGPFLSAHVARHFGLWENQYFFTGSGTNQPQGVFVGGTAAVTSDFATTIAASEIPEMFFKLKGEYRDSPACYWAMKDSTLGLIQGLDGDPFKFIPTPAGNIMQLWTKPVRTSSKIAAHTAALKSIVFGDFSYYMIAENRSLRVIRNPYLYQGNGQVGFFWSQRVGGAVLQAEAFQYMTAHS